MISCLENSVGKKSWHTFLEHLCHHCKQPIKSGGSTDPSSEDISRVWYNCFHRNVNHLCIFAVSVQKIIPKQLSPHERLKKITTNKIDKKRINWQKINKSTGYTNLCRKHSKRNK